MKVGRSSGSQGTSKGKKAGQGQPSDSSFGDMLADGLSQSASSGAMSSIAQVDALLAIQEVDDPMQGATKRRMFKRAEGVLDLLDDIRGAMLRGELKIGDMLGIADTIASHREHIDDPKLTAVLDEIDLRAQVELAKLSVAVDRAVD